MTRVASVTPVNAQLGSGGARVRLDMLDVVRFVAAAAIIHLHAVAFFKQIYPVTLANQIVVLGRFAVPFFTAAAIALTVDAFRRDPSRSLLSYFGSRLTRLYVPFLFWTAFYLALRWAKFRFVTHEPMIHLDWQILFVGSALHLWFLPFVFVATSAVAVLAKVSPKRVPLWGLGLVCLLLAAPCVWDVAPLPPVLENDRHISINYTLALAWDATPAACAGLVLGCMWKGLRDSRRRAAIAVGGGVILMGAVVLLILLDRDEVMPAVPRGLAQLAGVGAVLLAIGPWTSPAIRVLAHWGTVAYGIYLVHFAWLTAFEFGTSKLHVPRNLWTVLLTVLAAIVCSTATALVLARYRLTAWTLGNSPPKPRAVKSS